MKQKLLLLIVLGLAITQGAVAQDVGKVETATENFEAFVGEQDTHIITLSYFTNPSSPVVLNESAQQLSGTFNSTSISILGNDRDMFSTTILDSTESWGHEGITTTVTMEVTYHPTIVGLHTASICLDKKSQKLETLLELSGMAKVTLGDVNGDGLVAIGDVTRLIDHIIGNGTESENFIFVNADVDGDGIISIGDLTELIDYILGIPITRPCTFLLIDLTDGSTEEIMIDDKSTVKIAKPDLIIKSQRQMMNYPLDQIAQLRYEERIITIGNTAVSEHVIPSFSNSLKTFQP